MAVEVDSIVIQKARNGDMRALEQILDAFAQQIYVTAYRMCGNEQDALDVGQETAVRIWRYLPHFRGDAKLSTWIHRIVCNTCIDFLRKRKEDSINLDALGEMGVLPAAPEGEQPERVLERRETLARIDEALLQLPEEQRAAVIQRDVIGLPYDEIAQAQEVNLNTIKSRISRGRKNLIQFLNKKENSVVSTGNLFT